MRILFSQSLIVQFLLLTLIHASSPYAVNTVGTQPNGTDIGRYGYDTAGNRLSNSTNAQGIDYGLIGKAVTISQDSFTSSINHGPGGRRYLRVDANGNGNKTKTLYLNGMDYKIDKDGNVTRSIRINAKGYSPAAQVDIDSSGTNTYTYFVQDHLGSPVVSVNTSGTVNKRDRYDAWGQMTEATGVANIPNTAAEIKDAEKNRGYTGHELMAEFNMGQWNGRVFDYEIGAFPQADKFIQGRSTAALNRYALGQHRNPNVRDPSGYYGTMHVPRNTNFFHGTPLRGRTSVQSLLNNRPRAPGWFIATDSPHEAIPHHNDRSRGLAIAFADRSTRGTRTLRAVGVFEYRNTRPLRLAVFESDKAMRDELGVRDRRGKPTVVARELEAAFSQLNDSLLEQGLPIYDGFRLGSRYRDFHKSILTEAGMSGLEEDFFTQWSISDGNPWKDKHASGSIYQETLDRTVFMRGRPMRLRIPDDQIRWMFFGDDFTHPGAGDRRYITSLYNLAPIPPEIIDEAQKIHSENVSANLYNSSR